jgi:hypothetical protein
MWEWTFDEEFASPFFFGGGKYLGVAVEAGNFVQVGIKTGITAIICGYVPCPVRSYHSRLTLLRLLISPVLMEIPI